MKGAAQGRLLAGPVGLPPEKSSAKGHSPVRQLRRGSGKLSGAPGLAVPAMPVGAPGMDATACGAIDAIEPAPEFPLKGFEGLARCIVVTPMAGSRPPESLA